MNLSKIIEETGKRVRAGKLPADKLTNAEIKEVLETAIEIMKEALMDEQRIEIQGFAVIEVKRSKVKQVMLNGKVTSGERKRWVIRGSRELAQK